MRSSFGLVFLLALCASAGAQQFTQALPGYHYAFPRDHFNHPTYQTEWWYYTGNVRAPDGHRFGFELTFFRQGASTAASSSPWFVHDLYMAHLALSDISGGHYYATERLNRAGPGLAGINEELQTVWNGNWQTKIQPTAHHLEGVGERFSIELNAIPLKAPVIHGTDGISQKAAGAGHASHYVSFTRMKTTGTILLDGKRYEVSGDTWMDHEFFSDSMTDEVGWDWLSLQLDDGSELMLYRLRHANGAVDPYSSGTYVDAQGRSRHLTLQELRMTSSGATWKSDKTGAAYPVGWSVLIPDLSLQLSVSTPLQNQEFVSRFGPRYWEGAVDISGQRGSQPVHGSGYLEMTGYSKAKSPLFGASPR